MLRKSFLLFMAAPLLYAAYFSISACHLEPERVSICSVTLEMQPQLVEPGSTNTTIAPALFNFYIRAAHGNFCAAPAANPFIASCYASKRCYIWENNLDTATFSLTLSKPIIAGTDTLAAGTNIIHHPQSGKYAPIRGQVPNCLLDYEIGTKDSSVIPSLTFDTGTYAAHFSCRTTDGRQIDKEHYVVFRR